MRRKRNRKNVNRLFDESAIMNSVLYRHYFNRLLELAISMYEWKNLPKEIDERYLELTLCEQGHAVFFKDEELDKYLATKVALGGRFDVYLRPINYRAYASNGYNNQLSNDNSVLIYNNYLHTNTIDELKLFAMKLYDVDASVIVNAKAQKTPILISCDENQRLSMKNAYMDYEGNMPVIYGDTNLNPNSINVINTQAPYVADRLYTLKKEIWGEAMTYLGISNLTSNKKERLITNEVAHSQGSVISSRHSRLEQRRQACEKINEMYGLNLEVNFREDLEVEYMENNIVKADKSRIGGVDNE